ncbi:serine/threonine-protein phosphatase 6 regulatory subunit 3-like isoform X2 [Hibiscus syriacus]|uniref:Serine/threonine-protein phosphatase 6 regulatory subunit 3-like isoform X2 n=1 Tax=Hibiscus syriacus TaxID=106335 RepID=A0A6A3B1R7_HIBSY|nr:serine/threonine-protein phosphatase 6 regulatory subunit 3-like isoform X2 [Hibiscus syriacus]
MLVESILDKENFTLEELLDEEEIIQECKALNSRLINFLRVELKLSSYYGILSMNLQKMLTANGPSNSHSLPARFTCEIDVILKTLIEDEELVNLLFSFLEPNRPHSALLAGYFSKVVICLMLRKTISLMKYVQAHQDVLRQLVDLIRITSIMEVLVRLVGADDHVYPNFLDVMQWLADSNLLEMIVDKLNPSCEPEVHGNAAETLCAITRNAPSPLANKLYFVARIFGHALEDSHSKYGLVHSLSVCISLLDPKRSAIASPLMHYFGNQHMYEPPIPVNPETINAMLPKLGELLILLNVSSDEKILPTTYGELRPPLGKHRLKIVEFIAVLLRTGNEAAEKELVSSGTIQRVLDLFFERWRIISFRRLRSFVYFKLYRFLQTDKQPILSGDNNLPILPAAGKRAPRAGNIGHITRISNKLIQLGSSNSCIQAYLQENSEWNEWKANILLERNAVEKFIDGLVVNSESSCTHGFRVAHIIARQNTGQCDEDDIHDRDYDVAALANNLSEAFKYKIYGNDDNGDHGALDRDDDDVYFDDEPAEVVISSLRLGDEQGRWVDVVKEPPMTVAFSLFTNSNWFAFQDDRTGNAPTGIYPSEMMHEINLNGTANGGNSSSDDEVVVGEEDEVNDNGTCTSNPMTGLNNDSMIDGDTPEEKNMFGARPVLEWVEWGEPLDLQVGGSSRNPFLDDDSSGFNLPSHTDSAMSDGGPPSDGESMLPNGSSNSMDSSEGSVKSETSKESPSAVPSLFEDVEFIGVELEGTEKAMEQALKEGIVGEAGPLKRHVIPKVEKEKSDGGMEFNDANYWRVDHEVTVVE